MPRKEDCRYVSLLPGYFNLTGQRLTFDTVDRKVLHVHVDKGVKSGTRVEFRGEGDQAPGIQAGDVVFEIEQKPHPRFTRKDDDLLYNAEIDLVTCLAGGTIYVRLPGSPSQRA